MLVKDFIIRPVDNPDVKYPVFEVWSNNFYLGIILRIGAKFHAKVDPGVTDPQENHIYVTEAECVAHYWTIARHLFDGRGANEQV